ncbi:hypothetical protein PXJ20_32540 [Paraburkholderia sp. A1RI_3L]|uniref:hypothetical protein n=1 Tax=Paraburkholderia kururiensis TaxID=984307 RepID=UPI003B7C0A2C
MAREADPEEVAREPSAVESPPEAVAMKPIAVSWTVEVVLDPATAFQPAAKLAVPKD